jgi:hypothetical protein
MKKWWGNVIFFGLARLPLQSYWLFLEKKDVEMWSYNFYEFHKFWRMNRSGDDAPGGGGEARRGGEPLEGRRVHRPVQQGPACPQHRWE